METRLSAKPLCAALLMFGVSAITIAAEGSSENWTLPELVATALDRNAALAATRSAREAAREGVTAARGEGLPRLDAVGLGEYFPRRERVLIFRHGGPPRNPFQNAIASYGVEVTLPLYTSGRIEHGIALADARAQAAGHRIGLTRNALIFNVASTYYTALRLQRVIAAQEAALASLRESLRVAQLQHEVGRIALLERLRIETSVSQAERDLAGARNAYDQALEVLKELIAAPAEGTMDVTGDLSQAFLPEAAIESLRERALRNRPDLLALQQEVNAQREAAGIARSRLGLSVDLKGNYRGVTGIDDAITRDDAALLLQFRIPLYEGGVLRAQQRQEAARLEEAQFRLQDVRRKALAEVERAVLDVKATAPRAEAGRRAVRQAEESLRVEREKFAEGRGTSNDLLLAEDALLRSQTELAAALADSQIARAALNLAIGEEPVPVNSSPRVSEGVLQSWKR